METTVKLYTLGYRDIKTYFTALLFIAGNIILPQLCHLIPQGGMMLLPIYFFTLIGAYKYGWKTGLLTAIASPLLNSILFGMPAPEVLPAIIIKSTLLAIAAGAAAAYFKRVSIPIIALVVLAYQLAGTLAEWVIVKDIAVAFQDFRIGLPGMILQIFGGYLFIRYIINPGRKA